MKAGRFPFGDLVLQYSACLRQFKKYCMFQRVIKGYLNSAPSLQAL